MAPSKRTTMMEETRVKLISAARKSFAEKGYASSSMDDFTASAGLTRGALYHNFGDKKGLLQAVIDQIDSEMLGRMRAAANHAGGTLWDGFLAEAVAYIEMSLEPEIQRIILRDARAVLGGATPDSQRHCVASMQAIIQDLIHQGIVADASPQALASLIYGSLAEAAFWIADGDEGPARLIKGLVALELLLRGLLLER